MNFHYTKKRGYKLVKILVIILSAIVAGYILMDINIKPLVMSMAESRVEALAVKAMNDGVREIMTNTYTYDDLINVVQDDSGDISMIQADTMRMNDLAADIAILAQEKLNNLGKQGVGIPLWSIFGGQILAGRGPNINVKIVPVGSITTEFITEFQNAGINQTRHKIYLKATANIRIVIPTGGENIRVSSHILVAESIIVGNVPDNYVNVNDGNMLNLIP